MSECQDHDFESRDNHVTGQPELICSRCGVELVDSLRARIAQLERQRAELKSLHEVDRQDWLRATEAARAQKGARA